VDRWPVRRVDLPGDAVVLASRSGDRRLLPDAGDAGCNARRTLSRTARRCRNSAISIRSVTSARAVRAHLSAWAFARGLRGGIFTTSIPAADSTVVGALRVASPERLADELTDDCLTRYPPARRAEIRAKAVLLVMQLDALCLRWRLKGDFRRG
jgi:hypothetical protein